MGHIASIDVVSGNDPGAGLLAVGCFEDEAPAGDALSEESRRAVQRLAARAGFKGAEEQRGQTEAGPDGPVVAVYGLGARRDFTWTKLLRWLGRAAEDARHGGERHLAVALPAHAETSGPAAGRILRALALTTYRFDRFLSDADKAGRVERLAVIPPAGTEAAFRDALAVAGVVAGAVAFARDLANAPANEATPTWMEERARELAAGRGLAVTVLDARELAARGMGGLLAVGAGSDQPPRLLRLTLGHEGDGGGGGTGGGGGPRRRGLALVGKGVTFDSGGISIKPAADMEQMKFDKSGACAVLGAMRAAAELELGLDVRAYLPVAENMLSGDAYRPGDIVRCYNGKTVEITNTDAEGRMILADAMALAVEEGSEALVELSTLTGACVVALGHQAAGLILPSASVLV
ncbi:MAG TPA: M17 family peptidase N-terminal domain-containing protein, partial [Thermoanaerobaculia bacterium]|nr:M17 family peptidase N-terminal domain-containing protein [Thermoanaerobaculia bacterium]